MATTLDLDLDEEIRRQAAISALLAQQPDPPQLPDQPDVIQPKDTADWHKLANQVFDTKTDEQVVAPAPPQMETRTDEQVLDTGEAPATLSQVEKALPVKERSPDLGERGAPINPPDLGERGAPIYDTKTDEQVVPPPLDKGEAPAQLTRVERGELVGLPWHPAIRPNVPGFVEGSTNAIVNPAAGVVPPTPKPKYPDQIVTPDEASGKTSGINAPANVIDPRVPTPAPTKVTGGEGYWGGDLSQGPPGTKPDGTDNEPYWPKSDKDIALLPPGANYIDPKDQSQKVTPGAPTPPAQTRLPDTSTTPPVQTTLPDTSTTPPAQTRLTDTSSQPPIIQPKSTDDWNKLADSIWPSADSKTKAQPTAVDLSNLANPDGTPIPQRVQAVGNQDPAAFIVHHTGGRLTKDGLISTLKERGLGVEYFMDRDGNIYQVGDSGAQNIKTGWGPKGTGLNNSNIVGMEISANDDADVTDAQKQAFAKFIAKNYPTTPLFGHGEVNPGHKEADEGISAKNAALAYRESGAVPTGEPGTTPIETLVKLDQSGLNVTHYGYPGDETPDKDSAAGHGKYVENMIPGYDVALNAQAAAMVGNPKLGETFQFAGREWRYGDKVPEKYSDARFDIFDKDGTVLTGAMPVGRQVAAESKEPQSLDDLAKDWVKLSPEEQAAVEAQIQAKAQAAQAKAQATQQAETAAVYKLPEAQNSNIIGLYNRLALAVPDVSDQTRSQIQAKLKPEIIAQMRAKFPEIKTDDEAWAKAQSPVNPLDVGAEWGSKAIGFVQQFTEPMKKGAADTDKFSVDQFLNKVMPNASDADKHDYLVRLYGMPLDQRTAEIEARLGPGFVQPGNPYRDPNFLAQALDRLSDPNFQKRQADDRAKFQEEMKRNISSDPRLVDTGMDRIVNDTAQIPAAVAAFSNPALWPMALAQVHEQVMDGFKKEHPEWDAKTLQFTRLAFFKQRCMSSSCRSC
jgi:hypothetical protein